MVMVAITFAITFVIALESSFDVIVRLTGANIANKWFSGEIACRNDG
ncbi:hypothetical protein K0I73_14110 [Shewanella mesophila]|nr:hypothetical protein [Shewanella mesophila]QYJ85327.1 hypothetical protein K0I73_14110 [Shewanella mesophila]